MKISKQIFIKPLLLLSFFALFSVSLLMSSSAYADDTGDELIGPCTIGFWKNRADEKKGLLQYFPGDDFAAVVEKAVNLSGEVFTDPDDLLTALQSKGKRSDEERARQQLAALYLNLAAFEEFPDNQKCALRPCDVLTAPNSCGDSISVTDALGYLDAQSDIPDMDAVQQCADDLNNGLPLADASEQPDVCVACPCWDGVERVYDTRDGTTLGTITTAFFSPEEFFNATGEETLGDGNPGIATCTTQAGPQVYVEEVGSGPYADTLHVSLSTNICGAEVIRGNQYSALYGGKSASGAQIAVCVNDVRAYFETLSTKSGMCSPAPTGP